MQKILCLIPTVSISTKMKVLKLVGLIKINTLKMGVESSAAMPYISMSDIPQMNQPLSQN
jgi:hypothetical protein